MAADAGTITVKAQLDTGQLQSGFKELQKGAQRASAAAGEAIENNITKSFNNVKTASKNLKDAVSKHINKISDKIDDKVKDVAKKSAAMVGGAISTIVGGAVKCFSDYEQLAGGVDKLFGNASASVKKNAQDAFQTAGMSANQYMDTVTNFSASLISGLGGDTAKAAKVADVAIRDMADNANTFGTSMSEIEYAYKGFSKQNYTMLDNLKLGYGGTAAEMARLVNDSGVMGSKFKATAKNINKVSFDKLIEAVHVIQTRMKIAGTTSREAAGTLEGSFNSMKAAAQNFLTALGNGNDVDGAFQQMVKSAQTWLGNLMPVVKRVVDSIIKMLDEKFPQFMKPARQVVDFVIKNKDLIIGAFVAIGGALAAIRVAKFAMDLTSAIGTFVSITKATFGFVGALVKLGIALVCNPIGATIAIIAGIIAAVVALYLKCEGFRNFVNGAVKAIVSFFGNAATQIVGIFNSIVKFLKPPFDTIVAIVSAAIGGIITVVGPIVGFIVTMVQGIINTVTPIIQTAISIVGSVIEAIKAVLTPVVIIVGAIVTTIIGVLAPIVGFIAQLIGQIIQFIAPTIKFVTDVVAAIFNVLTPIADWIFKNVLTPMAQFIHDVITPIVSFISGVIQAIMGVVTPVISFIVGLVQGIINTIGPIINTIVQIVIGVIAIVTATITPIVGFIAGVVGKIFGIIGAIAGWIWKNVLSPVVGFYTKVIGGIIGAVVGLVGKIFGTLGAIAGWIWSHVIQPVAGFFKGLWDGICSGISGAAKIISDVFGTIVGIVKAPINCIIDLINGVIGGINSIKIPDWVPGLGGMSANIPKIPRLARGGFVAGAGTATSDSIPAMLSNGEYVINARAVDLIGRDTLDNLNAGKTEPAYRGGGSSTVNNFFQFDRQSNSRWQYEQITRRAL